MLCLFTSISVQAQQTSNDTATKFTPPVIVKDSVQKSENKKEEYKSKEWHQGVEVMTDTTNRAGEKPKSRMQKKAGKQRGTPPTPPPPPALPPAPPSPPAKD